MTGGESRVPFREIRAGPKPIILQKRRALERGVQGGRLLENVKHDSQSGTEASESEAEEMLEE